MTPTLPEFEAFPKIKRLSREIVITEKIDGTNAQVFITDEGVVHAGSRNRWVSAKSDNYGFASWVAANTEELLKLGPGRHFGEWWGRGIGPRGYGLDEKRFSLFNVSMWSDDMARPSCCGVVPTLYQGDFDTQRIEDVLYHLVLHGSSAAPGFMNPEGIVVFHTASGICFKKTIQGDEKHKSEAA